MRRRGQNMNLVTATFIYQDSLLFYDEIWCPQLARLACKNGNECSILICLVYGRGQIKMNHCAQNFIGKNGLEMRINQNAASSTKLYCRTVPLKRNNQVLWKKTNQNSLLRNKNTQIMRLHMIF